MMEVPLFIILVYERLVEYDSCLFLSLGTFCSGRLDRDASQVAMISLCTQPHLYTATDQMQQ